MTIPKFRAAIVVFLVGFALGLSVFVASRLFVRAILSSDAIAAAEELAAATRAKASRSRASGALSSIVRYTYFDLGGKVVASDAPAGETASAHCSSEGEARSARGARRAKAARSSRRRRSSQACSGCRNRRSSGVAVPVVAEGRTLGTLVVEVDQTRALESLSRAFSVVGMVTVGLAVLAVIAVAFVVTRGRGFGQHRRPSTRARCRATR